MKKIIAAIILAVMLMASNALATDGACTQTLSKLNSSMATLTFDCLASSSDGSFPSIDTTAAITAAILGYYIIEVRTNPGSTAPTTSYDIAINDADGIDLMGGTLVDRSTSASQRAIPALATGIYGGTAIDGTLSLVITNNIVHSAIIVIKIFLTR